MQRYANSVGPVEGNKDNSGSKTTNQQQTQTFTVWTKFHDCMCIIICVDHDKSGMIPYNSCFQH